MKDTHELIDRLHARLSHGVCKGCIVHIGRKGPSILQDECVKCERPAEKLPEGVDE